MTNVRVINAPRPLWYQPERPLAFGEGSNGLFASQEFDRGIKLDWAPQPYGVTLAVIDGTGAIRKNIDHTEPAIIHGEPVGRLSLKRRKECFHHGVVVAITATAHRAGNAVRLQPSP